MTFAGDCTLGGVNGNDSGFPRAYAGSGSLTYPFDGVRHLFAQDDLTVINFEGTLTDAARQADKEWRFRGPPEYARILPASSIEAVSLANNHAPYDYLEQGFRDTMANLRAAGVGVTYTDHPLVTVVNGVEVVVVSGSAALAEDKSTTPGAVALGVLMQIGEYKREGNIIIADMHWDDSPAWQARTARTFIDAGADLVVGHHAHALRGIERYKGKYIAYGLGNFAYGGSPLAGEPETILLHVTFVVENGQPAVAGIAVTPCYITSSTSRNANGVLRNDYRPRVVTGAQAEAVRTLLLERSRGLADGIDQVEFYGS